MLFRSLRSVSRLPGEILTTSTSSTSSRPILEKKYTLKYLGHLKMMPPKLCPIVRCEGTHDGGRAGFDSSVMDRTGGSELMLGQFFRELSVGDSVLKYFHIICYSWHTKGGGEVGVNYLWQLMVVDFRKGRQ